MISWTNCRPLPREIEEKLLRDMCVAYIAYLNPQRAAPEPNQITRRCQHCGTIFQHPPGKQIKRFCPVCR